MNSEFDNHLKNYSNWWNDRFNQNIHCPLRIKQIAELNQDDFIKECDYIIEILSAMCARSKKNYNFEQIKNFYNKENGKERIKEIFIEILKKTDSCNIIFEATHLTYILPKVDFIILNGSIQEVKVLRTIEKKEIPISHDEFLKLRNDYNISLGLANDVFESKSEEMISEAKRIMKKISDNAKSHYSENLTINLYGTVVFNIRNI